MNLFFQIWGGVFYLLNKIFFSISERKGNEERKRKWKIAAWSVYLIGLPGWLYILTSSKAWIVASVELCGAPSMIVGLAAAIKGNEQNFPVVLLCCNDRLCFWHCSQHL